MLIYEEALRLKRQGRTSAIATIVECRGSSPQKQGAKMLVRDDGSSMGTLGGGCLEADVVQGALMSLRNGEPMTMPFELTEREGGLVCGGSVLVYIEPVLPDPHLVILGAGHVGKTLASGTFSAFANSFRSSTTVTRNPVNRASFASVFPTWPAPRMTRCGSGSSGSM